MKRQATEAGVVCVVVLPVATEMVVMSEAAGCDIFQMMPCMAASKNAKVMPSRQCCTKIRSMGAGVAGANCLCSLLRNPLATSNGVVPSMALALPHKCRIAVPKGFVCQGSALPISLHVPFDQ